MGAVARRRRTQQVSDRHRQTESGGDERSGLAPRLEPSPGAAVRLDQVVQRFRRSPDPVRPDRQAIAAAMGSRDCH